MKNCILMHCNYFEKYSLEIIFKKSMEFGYDGIELRLPRENPEAQTSEFVRLRDKYNIQEITFNHDLSVLTDDDKHNVTEEIEKMHQTIEVVREKLNCQLINVTLGSPLIAKSARYVDYSRNGSAVATDVHYERAAKALHTLAEAAAQNEMKLVVEMHSCSLTDCAKATVKLLEMVNHPNLGVNFDFGNLYLIPRAEPLDEALALLREKIGYVHVKNFRRAVPAWWFLPLPRFRWSLTLLEEGEIDYSQVVEGLRRMGYCGYWTCEAPGLRGNANVHAAHDIAYLRKLITE